jgi:GMP synthase (glutamine-hydrolysing)
VLETVLVGTLPLSGRGATDVQPTEGGEPFLGSRSSERIPVERIAVLDLGSQYTFLIARRIREHCVYAEVLPPDTSAQSLARAGYRGIVLSGGPASVYDEKAPRCDPRLFALGTPVLGICYGMHLMAQAGDGSVQRAAKREFGPTLLTVRRSDPLWGTAPPGFTAQVWMSHGDKVEGVPAEFVVLASSANCPVSAMRHETLPLYGLQFHPEVSHTEGGEALLGRFVRDICGCSGDWTPQLFLQRAVAETKEQVGNGEVLCGVSGGIDSTVTAAIAARAVGQALHCVFVDHGLLRWGESAEVRRMFAEQLGIPLLVVNRSRRFLRRLRGIGDPEQKRVVIGHAFVEVFQEVARRWPRARFLAQGTLYPDRIESTRQEGPSATIKTHHNVGGLPDWMDLDLVEPLKDLFKDEVRSAARHLGLPSSLVNRHPFPGPGLAVRVVGEVTAERVSTLRRADMIFLSELRRAGYYDKVWQAFAVLLPVQSVGVMGDERTYEDVVALRAVVSTDAMTADWARLPAPLLARASNRIINEVRGVNRVVYDVSSKPPSTIEWE